MIGFSHFYDFNKSRFVLDSNPLKSMAIKPVIEKLKFDLQFNEAVLEYRNHNKTFFIN
jgi:hypothetical protein